MVTDREMRSFLILSLIILSNSLFAHPHVFIDIGLEIDSKDEAVISWTFDPIESGNKIYFFDDNGDGFLDEQETLNLYNESFRDLDEYNYFITIKDDYDTYPVKEVYDFKVSQDENRLTIFFSIKLPELKGSNKLSITHFDTSYFISFGDPDPEKIRLNNLYFAVLKNKSKPFYYDPAAGRSQVIDTSKPGPGYIKTYPTEIFISREPILDSFGDYKLSFKEKLTLLQRAVYINLSGKLQDVKNGESTTIVISLMLLAFIYGAVHALGPGHRKLIISSYILSRKKISYAKGIGISLLSALIHSGSGILSILLLNLIFSRIHYLFIDNLTNYMELISYISVGVLSIILIILKISEKKRASSEKDNQVALSVIILSSLVPCPGAITIMLFSLSLGIIPLGIVTVFAMSLGIGVTLSVIALLSLKSKRVIESGGNKFKNIESVVEWSGLILLLIFSLLMCLAVI